MKYDGTVRRITEKKEDSDMAVLQASHLKKYYGREESLVKALDDVSVSV